MKTLQKESREKLKIKKPNRMFWGLQKKKFIAT